MLDAPWRPYASPVLVELPAVATSTKDIPTGTTYVDPSAVMYIQSVSGYTHPVTRVVYMTEDAANHIEVAMTVGEVRRRFRTALTAVPPPVLRRETVEKIQAGVLSAIENKSDLSNLNTVRDILYDAGISGIMWEYTGSLAVDRLSKSQKEQQS